MLIPCRPSRAFLFLLSLVFFAASAVTLPLHLVACVRGRLPLLIRRAGGLLSSCAQCLVHSIPACKKVLGGDGGYIPATQRNIRSA